MSISIYATVRTTKKIVLFMRMVLKGSVIRSENVDTKVLTAHRKERIKYSAINPKNIFSAILFPTLAERKKDFNSRLIKCLNIKLKVYNNLINIGKLLIG